MEGQYRYDSSEGVEDAPRPQPARYPGKRTLTARLAVARKAHGDGRIGDDARAAVERALQGGGAGLTGPVRERFEASLGVSLADVRIHTGAAATQAAAALSAKAYTLGGDIFFADGQYDPASPAGQELLAHEVAHTVQQRGASATATGDLEVSAPGDHHEVEADAAAAAMVGGTASAVTPATGVARQVLQRAGDPAAAPAASDVKITAETVAAAPGGGKDRFVLGVGEQVKLTGSTAGEWTASGGEPTSGSGTELTWKAPAKPGTFTIKLKAGDKEATKAFSVIAPTTIKFKKTSDKSFPSGTQGAGMNLDMHIGADNVSFGAVKVKEVPSGAHDVTGYFADGKQGDLSHNPSEDWSAVNDQNDLRTEDEAYFDSYPAPWSPGTLSWSIVHQWSVDGSAGTPFTIVTQTMKIVDNKGTSIVTKGSAASAARTP